MSIQILSIILSAAAALIGGMVLLYLRTISRQITDQNDKIKIVESDLKVSEKDSVRRAAECKDHCYQNFVGKVDYIREMSRTTKYIDDQTRVLGEVNGNLKMITMSLENMPKICGNIASQIVKEMKKECMPNG